MPHCVTPVSRREEFHGRATESVIGASSAQATPGSTVLVQPGDSSVSFEPVAGH